MSLGKRFTPAIGSQLVYGGCRFKDCEKQTQKYQSFHADLLWNVLATRNCRQEEFRLSIIPYMGMGLLHNRTNGQKPFALNYGVIGQYHISKRITVNVEIGNATTFRQFDGHGKNGRLGDHLLSATAGLSFSIGKMGWKRAVDARPYMVQNEWLLNRTNELLASNHRLASRHDRDARTLTELKKNPRHRGLA